MAAMMAAVGQSGTNPTDRMNFYDTHGNPIYIPRKHHIMNYATQNRLAKKRRNNKQKHSK